MNFTPFSFSGKPLASLSLGCMRFPGREAASDIIHAAAARDVLYLDTSPGYCFRTEEENSEAWVGAAVRDIRDKVIVSTKCSPGNGGDGIGEWNKPHGFNVRTADEVRAQMEQSLTRMGLDRLDCYQLWAIHTAEQFDEAMKPGGWLEGVQKAREEGVFTHLGITGHAPTGEIKRWVDSGLFEMITVPFHIMDTSRLEGIRYALDRGLAVIAMNPLAGGLLGSASDSLARELPDAGVTSARDLALRYVASVGTISALSGMTSVEDVEQNVETLSRPLWSSDEAESVRARFEALLGSAEYVCTGCRYCEPCEQGLDIAGILQLRNYHVVLNLDTAKRSFQNRYKHWGERYKADECIECGICEGRCPNGIPVSMLMKEVMETLGEGLGS